MTRRAAPGDPARIEAVLEPVLREALERMRELFNILDWQQTPLDAPFQQCATVLLAAQLVAAGTCSEKDALDHAAIWLGVNSDTVRSRGKRWPRNSRSSCTPTEEPAADTLAQHSTREVA